jgi:GTP-binding protein
MSLPVVAIVGRPNVGKSTLFNSLLRRRVAIEEPTAGVTRDRISAVITHEGRSFELIDTGGIGIEDSMGLSEQVEAQIQIALEHAHVLVFVIDIKSGITPLDDEVGARLRQLNVPIILIANKCDSRKDELNEGDVHRLGLGRPVLCSAIERTGCVDILDIIQERLPEGMGYEPPPAPVMKLAIVGKRNVGKSSLVNALAREERVIVSEVPGTTRDAIDVLFEVDGKKILAIDTAGVRKKKSIANSIEFFSLDRAQRSIRRADVVLLVMDCKEEVSNVERQLAAEIDSVSKPCILTINKWDMAGNAPVDTFAKYVKKTLPGFSYAPVCFISAKTRLNLVQMMRLALELHEQAGVRVGTGELNRAIEQIVTYSGPRPHGTREGKVYYCAQVGVHPPTIVLFVNDRRLFDANYMRYVERSFRKRFGFSEIPLNLRLKDAHRHDWQRLAREDQL